MKNTIKTFQLYIRPDERSQQIADNIRALNAKLDSPLEESTDGDLVIALGGDGTFIHAVTDTKFSKRKIYTGIHTGTLGFMQDLCENDIYTLIRYINHEEEIQTRKVYVSAIKITMRDGTVKEFQSLNEILVVGKNYSKISFKEYINGDYLQMVSGNGIVIASSAGDTAYSLNAKGAIDFSRNFQLVCTLETPMIYAINERFIDNPIICSQIKVVLEESNNIQIIIDGREKQLDSRMIESVEVSMLDEANHINKLDLTNFSKVRVFRNKILGYP